MLALFKEFIMENSSSNTRQCETFAESRNVTDIKFASFIGVDRIDIADANRT